MVGFGGSTPQGTGSIGARRRRWIESTTNPYGNSNAYGNPNP